MSECIICKGNENVLINKGFIIKDVDSFLSKGAFWIGNQNDNMWTFIYKGKDIDKIVTDANEQMHNGIPFEDTTIYNVINVLYDNHISFAMWYDIYFDDLDICKTKKEVLETCYNHIMDISGMCEVYIVFNDECSIVK